MRGEGTDRSESSVGLIRLPSSSGLNSRNGHPGRRGGEVSTLRGLGTDETAAPPVRFLPLILFSLIVGVGADQQRVKLGSG